MQLFNLTPFAADRVVTSSRQGRDTLLVVVKGTFSLASQERGVPLLAAEQAPITLVDTYAGEPGQSSLSRPSDLVPEKPGAEVFVTGHLIPAQSGVGVLDVALTLGTVDKQVRVFGDRVWERSVFGYRASAPAPITRMPIAWERAFGGFDETTQERFGPNPIGCGFMGKKSQAKLVGTPVPNFVDRGAPLEAPGDQGRAVGFGALAPAWAERRQYAGTYDDAWLRDTSPFLPDDFDVRYFLAAPPDQRLSRPLVGGERGRLGGLAPDGQLDFLVPRARLEIEAMMGAELESMAVVCDTVILELDTQALVLVWRARLDVQDRLDELRWIRVAEVGR
jgi:hypothetical protein